MHKALKKALNSSRDKAYARCIASFDAEKNATVRGAVIAIIQGGILFLVLSIVVILGLSAALLMSLPGFWKLLFAAPLLLLLYSVRSAYVVWHGIKAAHCTHEEFWDRWAEELIIARGDLTSSQITYEFDLLFNMRRTRERQLRALLWGSYPVAVAIGVVWWDELTKEFIRTQFTPGMLAVVLIPIVIGEYIRGGVSEMERVQPALKRQLAERGSKTDEK
jgi:hypothetical protein